MKGQTPVRAIRAKCLECSAGQVKEVRDCSITDCPLYPFRMGKNPNRQGIGPRRILVAAKLELSGQFSEKKGI